VSPNVLYTRAQAWPAGPHCPPAGTGSSPAGGGSGSGVKTTGTQSDACVVERGVPTRNRDVPDV
jgi:hypothetical protein